MPPFIPSKRQSSDDLPPPKRHATAITTDSSLTPLSSSSSPLTPVPSDNGRTDNGRPKNNNGISSESEESDSDEVDWEDAIDASIPPTATSFVSPQDDLELTLDKNEVHLEDILQGQKAPSKIERQIRLQVHRMHVLCLLAHNALRNAWANDSKCHDILRQSLPPAIQKEVQKWRRTSGLEREEPPKAPPKKKQGKAGEQSQRQAKAQQRDWGEGSSRQEPGEPDLSNGDPIIHLLRILSAYWKKKFKVSAPGLRKHGYRPMAQVQTQTASFHNDDHDPESHGEKIASVEEFRAAAERMEGSRDVGAQLFTALLRALDIEARLVASLQPLGFGWTKAEAYSAPKPKEKAKPSTQPVAPSDGAGESGDLDYDDDEDEDKTPPTRSIASPQYDQDLPFPIYWTEVASPITHQIITVDPLVLSNPVAATSELQAAWEPRGTKAEKAKQVICYVVAYSSDKTAKDVTTRYLRRRTWPGKTKGFRLVVGKKSPNDASADWFRSIISFYERPQKDRTAVDNTEDSNDLVPNQPNKNKPPTDTVVDTLQSLRTSTEFVLERFLRREEALRPGALPVRTFTPGGVKNKANPKSTSTSKKAENIYLRTDIVKCQSAESWHKEGRQPRPGETALKHVPIRAVTLLRKREVDEQARRTGQKPLQGLYSFSQTEEIIPPPIEDGIIPKNDYGNIDCFVPRMVPRGAIHIPWPGTARVCKKLGIDYAEAVTGFEFGSQMAVPVIEGVVVAVENGDLVKDAWRADHEEKRRKEERKAEAKILQTWRKFLFGLRIAQRVREEYAGDEGFHLPDAQNPFASSRSSRQQPNECQPYSYHPEGGERETEEDVGDRGGGFLLADHDDDGGNGNGNDDDLIVEERRAPLRRAHPQIEETDSDELDSASVEGVSPSPSPPPKCRRTRNTNRGRK